MLGKILMCFFCVCSCGSSVLTHNIAVDETDSISLDHSISLSQSRHSLHSTHSPFHHSQSPRHSIHSQSPLHSSNHSQSPVHSTQCSVLSSHSSGQPCPSPPPLPERSDSLAAPDEPHLRAAAWFQAGIPR